MSTDHAHTTPPPQSSGLPRRAVLGAVLMAALIGIFFLLREHREHLAGSWAYLLLLACPVMHMFHHGHGGHGGRQDHGSGLPRAKDR